MKTKLFLLLITISFISFITQAQTIIFSQKLDTSFTTDIIKIASPLSYDVLCISQDCTVYNSTSGTFSPMKGTFGSAWYLPGNFSAGGQSSGTVYVTHTTNIKNATLGDGGGLIKFKVQKDQNNKWTVVPTIPNVYYLNVDLKTVGGSVGNRDITMDKYTPSAQTILISESMLQKSNTDLGNGMINLSNYTVPSNITQSSNPDYVVPQGTILQRFQQMNWMIEVNAANGSAIQKLYPFGRFNHAYCIKGLGGYYMTTGMTPSVLFKWVPDQPDNLQIGGELFAFKQNPNTNDEFISLNNHKLMSDGTDSTWQAFDSLLIAEDQALRAGATMFANLSGMALDNVDGIDVLYIAERGIDNSGDAYTNPAKKYNGVLAEHLSALDASDGSADGVLNDYNGRILAYSADAKMQVVLEGGKLTDQQYYFSNPESITMVNGAVNPLTGNFKKHLIIHENVNGIDHERNPSHVTDIAHKINEAYWLEAPVAMDYSQYGGIPTPINPVLDDLNLFLIGPNGSTIAGGNSYDLTASTEKNDTYFVCITDTNTANPSGNKSKVIAAKGLFGTGQTTSIIPPVFTNSSDFQVWPNPASNDLHFNKKTDLGLYNISGILMKVYKNVDSIDVYGLTPGVYFITNGEAQVKKIIIE